MIWDRTKFVVEVPFDFYSTRTDDVLPTVSYYTNANLEKTKKAEIDHGITLLEAHQIDSNEKFFKEFDTFSIHFNSEENMSKWMIKYL